jgi:Ferredoxin-dependent bilin reductase
MNAVTRNILKDIFFIRKMARLSLLVSLGLCSVLSIHGFHSALCRTRRCFLLPTRHVAENDAIAVESNNDDSVQDKPLPLVSSSEKPFGLYHSFATAAWNRLLDVCGRNLEMVPLDEQLSFRESPAPGGAGGTVRVSIRAARGKTPTQSSSGGADPPSASLIQYARFALLETLTTTSDDDDECCLQTSGIQVLNLVIFPTASSGLPVFGADFVALPGDKHLLLLDAQPMMRVAANANANPKDETPPNFRDHWKAWYERHGIAEQFPWNSELPEAILPYISPYALWTRLGSGSSRRKTTAESTTNAAAKFVETEAPSPPPPDDDDPIAHITGPGRQAFLDHLEIYLELIQSLENSTLSSSSSSSSSSSNSSADTSAAAHQSQLIDYVQYRLDNDPARPMLKRLYGEEWTELVLEKVLFPLSELNR